LALLLLVHGQDTTAAMESAAATNSTAVATSTAAAATSTAAAATSTAAARGTATSTAAAIQTAASVTNTTPPPAVKGDVLLTLVFAAPLTAVAQKEVINAVAIVFHVQPSDVRLKLPSRRLLSVQVLLEVHGGSFQGDLLHALTTEFALHSLPVPLSATAEITPPTVQEEKRNTDYVIPTLLGILLLLLCITVLYALTRKPEAKDNMQRAEEELLLLTSVPPVYR
jgi:hypothetical protein